MQRNIENLAEQQFDLVIIGAGIFGACAAWEATRQNLKVAVIDKQDFSHATSAHHFKMIHGGMRYLQHLDFPRLFESSHERSALIRIAPHLAYPLPILMPTYGHGMKGKEILRLGFKAYELLTMRRNKGIKDPSRRLPPSRFLSPEEVVELYPTIEKDGLTGGVLFCDGQMYNPPRIALSFLRSAEIAVAGTLGTEEILNQVPELSQRKTNLALEVIDADNEHVRLYVTSSLAVKYEGEWVASGLTLAGVVTSAAN